MVLLWLGGAAVTEALRYDRSPIIQGDYWRLITGHLVHLDARHLILNLAAGGLMVLLFGHAFGWRQSWLVVGVSVLAIDFCFLVFEPQLRWYVGLSGVLHGVLAAGAVAWWRSEPRWLAALLTAIVGVKLIFEQWQGALPLAGEVPVIVDAHLYGALGGAAIGLFLFRRATRIDNST